MESPRVTIVITPRERFSGAKKSLDSIFAHTNIPFNLVYIDGNAPKRTAAYLKRESESRQFKLIRTEYYLTPNEARNLGFSHVETEFVVFVDNDLIVQNGWLEALVECADETGAWIVGPTYLIGKPEDGIIHLTSGEATFFDVNGARHFKERHLNGAKNLGDIQDSLSRAKSGFAEFHCMLCNTSRLQQLGGLDEGFLSSMDHVDICLQVRNAGGETYHEPASIVTYVPAKHFLWPSDLRFYLWRWSDKASISSILRFQQKYGLQDDDEGFLGRYSWVTYHRRRPVRWLTGIVRIIFGMKAHARFARVLDKVLTPKNDRRDLKTTDALWAKV
jgi:GT2 family glycosyltransferase